MINFECLNAGMAISYCEKLLSGGMFRHGNKDSVYYEPALVSILINLSDVLRICHCLGVRVDSTNDIDTIQFSDVTDLIIHGRNSACHFGSKKRYLESIKLGFVRVNGIHRIEIDENTVFECKYNDDTAFYWLNHPIYLKRHIVRSVERARYNLKHYYAQTDLDDLVQFLKVAFPSEDTNLSNK